MDKKKFTEAKKKHAEKNGFTLNPDQAIVDMIINGLLENTKKHGAPYCPCRPLTGNKKEDRKIICPCIYHKDEIAKDGRCHCWLFVKKQ